jgi:hypothetical protein
MLIVAGAMPPRDVEVEQLRCWSLTRSLNALS